MLRAARWDEESSLVGALVSDVWEVSAALCVWITLSPTRGRMTDEEWFATELAEAEAAEQRSQQFLLVAEEILRVMDAPHAPGDQERREYLDTLLTELRKINTP